MRGTAWPQEGAGPDLALSEPDVSEHGLPRPPGAPGRAVRAAWGCVCPGGRGCASGGPEAFEVWLRLRAGVSGGPPYTRSRAGRILLAVGQAAILPDRHGLLLDVVLREQARLARHHLLDGGRDDHVVYVVVRLPWLPLLWGDDL